MLRNEYLMKNCWDSSGGYYAIDKKRLYHGSEVRMGWKV